MQPTSAWRVSNSHSENKLNNNKPVPRGYNNTPPCCNKEVKKLRANTLTALGDSSINTATERIQNQNSTIRMDVDSPSDTEDPLGGIRERIELLSVGK